MAPSRRDFLKQLAAGAALAGFPMVTPGRVQAQESDEAPKSLLVIGWDGAGLINVNKLLQEDRLPFLKHFVNHGGALVPLELLGFTNTATSWAHVFTGLTYDQTSIMGNWRHDAKMNTIIHPIDTSPYCPQFKSSTRVFAHLSSWIEAIPFEHTILKPIQERTYKTGWFVSKRLLGDHDLSPFRDIALKVDSYFLHDPQKDVSRPAGEQKPDDAYLGNLSQAALEFVTGPEPFFAFLHQNPDYYGHRHGEPDPRYLEEFIRCDKWLGILLRSIDRSKINIIVIADHGFTPGKRSHNNAPDAWMATDLPVHPDYCQQSGQRAFGTMRDVAHTILSHFRIPYENMPLQMRGKSLLT